MTIIVVNSGDTVSSLARQYGVMPEKLIQDNGIPEDGALAVGQSLVILTPDEVYDVVGQQQTVSSISAMFSQSTKTTFRNNIFLSGNAIAPQNSQVVISYESKPSLRKFLGGYAYDFIDRSLLNTVISYMTYIMPFTYGFRGDGSLIAPNDEFIINTANEYNVRPLMHLSTLTDYGNFSSALASQVLNNATAYEALIENILANVKAKGYYGVDVDFEFLPANDRQAYVRFIEMLTETMNENGLICIVALPPKTSDTQVGLLYEGIDYAALGEAANYAFLMTYEWGYRFGPPLPVAPVPSVRRVLDYAVTRIPPEKLILGISNYGYDWTIPFVAGQSDAPSLSTEYALSLAVKYGAEIMFDEAAQAPYFYYTDELGNQHIVWFEDARSYKAKVELMEEYGLSGGFIWDLMRRNPQGYVTLNALIDIETL